MMALPTVLAVAHAINNNVAGEIKFLGLSMCHWVVEDDNGILFSFSILHLVG